MAEEGKAGVPDPRLGSNWGTIIQPPFELGFQKLDKDSVQGITERLHTTETKARKADGNAGAPERQGTAAGPDEVAAIVERLSTITKPVPESKRVGAIDDSGILNSYAWKGWKTADSIRG